jgi:hypothetical protein
MSRMMMAKMLIMEQKVAPAEKAHTPCNNARGLGSTKNNARVRQPAHGRRGRAASTLRKA